MASSSTARGSNCPSGTSSVAGLSATDRSSSVGSHHRQPTFGSLEISFSSSVAASAGVARLPGRTSPQTTRRVCACVPVRVHAACVFGVAEQVRSKRHRPRHATKFVKIQTSARATLGAMVILRRWGLVRCLLWPSLAAVLRNPDRGDHPMACKADRVEAERVIIYSQPAHSATS